MKMLFDLQLTDKETFFIGNIVAAWASLEHEVFVQTLFTYVAADEGTNLPKEMNNVQFTGVLRLWKARVLDQANGKRKRSLETVYERILKGHEYRKAIVHGMWNWSPENVERITSTRIVGKKIVSVNFDAVGLESFMTDLLELNFDLRFPRGVVELAKQRSEHGGFMSRRFVAMMTGKLDDAWLSQRREPTPEIEQNLVQGESAEDKDS